MLGLLTPLVVQPTMSRLTGDQGWGSVVTAISLGSVGWAAITWGWNLLGPPKVVRAKQAQRWASYQESMHTRLLLAAIVLPLCAIFTAMLVPAEFRIATGLTAVAFAAVGLLPQWYCIGIGSSKLLGFFDAIPRLIGTLISIPIMLFTRSILAYPILLLATIAVSLWLFPRKVFPGQPAIHFRFRESWRSITQMGPAAIANLIPVAYSYAPMPIAQALLSNTAASHFGSADNLFRYSLYAITSLANALQGWTLEVEGSSGRQRQIAAIAAHTALAILGGGLFILLGVWASKLLLGADVIATQGAIFWYGMAFFFLCISTPLLRNLLVPNGRARLALLATVVAAVIGLSVMFLSGFQHNPTGIAAGMAGSEGLILAILLVPALKILNKRYPISVS